MQISDLSLREQIALQLLPSLLDHSDSVDCAFDITDQFMRKANRYRDEVAEAKEQAKKAELSADLLRSMNNDGQFGVRIALEQIWEFLGTNNQTDTMQMLNDAFPELRK